MIKNLIATSLLTTILSGPLMAQTTDTTDTELAYNDDIEEQFVSKFNGQHYVYYYKMHQFSYSAHYYRYGQNTGYNLDNVMFDYVLTTYVNATYRYDPVSITRSGFQVHRVDYELSCRKITNTTESTGSYFIYPFDIEGNVQPYFENQMTPTYLLNIQPYMRAFTEWSDDYSVEFYITSDRPGPTDLTQHLGYGDASQPWIYNLDNELYNATCKFTNTNDELDNVWNDFRIWSNAINVIDTYATEAGSPIYDAGFSRGREVGFGEGYRDAELYYNRNSDRSVFGLLKSGFNAISGFLGTELAPGFSVGLLISIPIAVGIIVVCFKLVAK